MLLGRASYINSTAVGCPIPAWVGRTRPPAYILYSHDGTTYSTINALFAVVGEAATVAIRTPADRTNVRSGATAMIPRVKLEIVDANDNSLLAADPLTTRWASIAIWYDGAIEPISWDNSSVTAALKNVIDWVSRAETADEPALSALAGKTAVICAASPGGLGGLRGLVHLRAILGNLGITVLPDQLAVPSAHSAFAEDGTLADPKQAARVRALGTTLAQHLAKLLR